MVCEGGEDVVGGVETARDALEERANLVGPCGPGERPDARGRGARCHTRFLLGARLSPRARA